LRRAVRWDDYILLVSLSLDACADMCPHCGKVNVFPGLSKVIAYICRGMRAVSPESQYLRTTEERVVVGGKRVAA
jgi:hypothetical protein